MIKKGCGRMKYLVIDNNLIDSRETLIIFNHMINALFICHILFIIRVPEFFIITQKLPSVQ